MKKTRIKILLTSLLVVFSFFILLQKEAQAQTKCETNYYQGQCTMSCTAAQINLGQKDCPANFTCCALSCKELGGTCTESNICLEKSTVKEKTYNQECDNEGKVCCAKEITDCSKKNPGEKCYTQSGESGNCYNGKCETKKGALGEPCGNNTGSICVKSGFCNDQDLDLLSGGGRNCNGMDLTCCKKSGFINSCADNGGQCYKSSEIPNDYYRSVNQTYNTACTNLGYEGCYFQGECAKQDGACMTKCTASDVMIANDDANESCGSGKVCCTQSLCAQNGGQCVDKGTACDNPLTQYDGSCWGDSICCGPIKAPSEKCKDYEEGLEKGFLLFKGSLVPCGRSCDDPGTELDETKTCTLCHFIILFKRLYDLLFSMIIIVSLVMLTVSGVLYIFSAGNPGLNGIAKGMLTKTLTGFGLFLLSWLLVFTILKFISAKTDVLGKSSGNWFEFTCDIESKFEAGAQKAAAHTTPTTPTTPTAGGLKCSADKNLPETNNFLACMQGKTSADLLGTITTFQGAHTCDLANNKISCHYGGTKCNGSSNAVDFGGPGGSGGGQAYQDIVNLAKTCSPTPASVRCENSAGDKKDCADASVNHVHVTVRSDCGCN